MFKIFGKILSIIGATLTIARSIVDDMSGADPEGLETPPPEIYQRSQKSDVLV